MRDRLMTQRFCSILASVIAVVSMTACETEPPACFDEAGRLAYDHVRTDAWQLGSLPFWTTPEEVIRVYGPPPQYYEDRLAIEEMQGAAPSFAFGEHTNALSSGASRFMVIGDTLAYPEVVGLLGRALQTDRGTIRLGGSRAEVAALFPLSAECSRGNGSDVMAWLRDPIDDFISVSDTVRRARISLLFQRDSLFAVGVASYSAWRPTRR